jgi:hypothetical protein
MQLRAVICVLAVALGSCATTPSMDRRAETTALARQLGIAESGVSFVAKCEFARAPKDVANGPGGVGSCLYAQDALHIRVIDATTGKSKPYGSFSRDEMESISLYEGFPGTQIQVRVRPSRDIVAMVMKPDSGLGSNAADTKALFELMFAVGYMGVPPGRYIERSGN